MPAQNRNGVGGGRGYQQPPRTGYPHQDGRQQVPQRRMMSVEEEEAEINRGLESSGFTAAFAPLTDDQINAYMRNKQRGNRRPQPQPQPSQAARTGVMQPQPTMQQPVHQGDPVIEMSHITKIYDAQPNNPALSDINVKIYPGEFVFLTGHSGAGKSTFLNMILWEPSARPTSGDISVSGVDLKMLRPNKLPFLRRQIGSVFQDFKLLEDRTVYQNVAFILECLDKPEEFIDKQVPEVLRLVGLADQMDSYPNELSGGERQRVSIARAMVNRPPLLLCDEPTGNLDPKISVGIMRLLNRINQTGTTVICSTHDKNVVDSMRKRVIAFSEGHIVYDKENSGYYVGI